MTDRKIKRPSLQWYPNDWRGDTDLQSCSVAARGLWHEMCLLMHGMTPYGELRIGGKPLPVERLALMVGASLGEVRRLVAELEAAVVFSRREDGAIFSRRMVRDESERRRWADSKRSSRYDVPPMSQECPGNVPDLSRECPADVPLDVLPKVPVDVPPMSRLSSSSSSSSLQEPDHKKRDRVARARVMPEGFAPNLAHAALAGELGVDLTAEFSSFCDYQKAHRKTYADWDAALRNWLRNAVKFSQNRGQNHAQPAFSSAAERRHRANAEAFDGAAEIIRGRAVAAAGGGDDGR